MSLGTLNRKRETYQVEHIIFIIYHNLQGNV